MKKIDLKKVEKFTGDYEAYLHEHLRDKEAACVHLQVALDEYQVDHDKAAFLLAIKDVAIAQGGVGKLAKETGINREHLYHLLSGKGNPTIDTLTAILKAFGVHFKLEVV